MEVDEIKAHLALREFDVRKRENVKTERVNQRNRDTEGMEKEEIE